MAETNPSKFSTCRDTIRRLGPAGWVGVIAGTLPPVASLVILSLIKFIVPWLSQRPVGGPATAVFAGMILGGTMLMPTYAFAVICGASFGALKGTLIAMTGIMLGGTLNVLWARPVCGNRLVDLINEHPKLALLYRELLGSNPKRAFALLTLIRIPPGFPFALTNLLVTALRVPFLMILGSVAIGSIPRTAIVVTAAARIADQVTKDDFELGLGLWPVAITIASAILMLVIVGRIASKVLQRMTNQPAVIGVP